MCYRKPEIAIDFGTSSFDHMVDVIADDVRIVYFVYHYCRKMYRDSGQFVFHTVSLFKDRAVCTVLQENRLAC